MLASYPGLLAFFFTYLEKTEKAWVRGYMCASLQFVSEYTNKQTIFVYKLEKVGMATPKSTQNKGGSRLVA